MQPGHIRLFFLRMTMGDPLCLPKQVLAEMALVPPLRPLGKVQGKQE